MLKTCYTVVKSYWWHMENIIYWENYHAKSLKKFKVKLSDIKGLKKDVVENHVNAAENIDSVDTLVGTVTVDFGCVSSSSQAKNTMLPRQTNLLIAFFYAIYIVQFC